MNTPWSDIEQQLDTKYSKQYFFGHEFHADNIMSALAPVPGYEEKLFFGPKMLNIFIISEPIGWKFDHVDGQGHDIYVLSWPPDGWQEALDRYAINRLRWANYRTRLYVDTYTAQRIVAVCPNSDMLAMMTQTAAKVQQACGEIPGFEYGGTIESQVEPSFFYSLLDDFYGINQ